MFSPKKNKSTSSQNLSIYDESSVLVTTSPLAISTTLTGSINTQNDRMSKINYAIENLKMNSIVDSMMIAFLEWARSASFNPKKISNLQRGMGLIGLGTGILSAYSAFPLGGDFGNTLSDFFEINNDIWRDALYLFFAANAYIPMAALSAISAQEIFSELVANKKNLNKIEKNNMQIVRAGCASIVYILSAFASVQRVYLTIDSFRNINFWNSLFALPAFIGCYATYQRALGHLNSNALNKLSQGETKEIKRVRQLLKLKLGDTLQNIMSMSDSDMLDYFDIIIAGKLQNQDTNLPVDLNTITAKKLRILFNLSKDTPTTKSKINYKRLFFTKTLAAIGSTASYAYYTVGEEAANAITDYVGITGRSQSAFAIFLGAMVVIPITIFYGVASDNIAGKLYDFLLNGSNEKIEKITYSVTRKILATFAIIEGILSATPQVYLAIYSITGNPWYFWFLVLSTFIAQASLGAYSINQLCIKAFSWLAENSSSSNESKREKIGFVISNLANVINSASDDVVMSLFRLVEDCISDTDKNNFGFYEKFNDDLFEDRGSNLSPT